MYILDTNAVSALMKGDAVLVTANTDDMIRIPGLTIENWVSSPPRR